MRHVAGFALAGCILLALTGMNAAAQRADQTIGGTGAVAAPPKSAPALNDAQRQQVWKAVMARATDDKLPADFQPVVGAKVPVQKKLPLHPLPRPLVNEVPVLKQYYYAKLPDKVLLVDPISRKVVEVIVQ
jgi:Protein of unknown function (DUF1236)